LEIINEIEYNNISNSRIEIYLRRINNDF